MAPSFDERLAKYIETTGIFSPGGFKICRLPGGHHNVNYRVSTPTTHYVLRFHPAPSSLDLIAREFATLRSIHPFGPEPIHLGKADFTPGSIMLMEHIPGVHKSYAGLTDKEIGALARHFAQLHSSTISRTFSPAPHVNPQVGTYQEYAYAVHCEWFTIPLTTFHLERYPDSLSLLDTAESLLHQVWLKNAQLFSGSRFSLLHNDPGPANVLWQPDGGITLIDWTEANYGDPADELSALFTINNVEPLFRNMFLEAYLQERPDPSLRDRTEAYTLRHRLADLAWAIGNLEKQANGQEEDILKQESGVYRSYYIERLTALRRELELYT